MQFPRRWQHLRRTDSPAAGARSPARGGSSRRMTRQRRRQWKGGIHTHSRPHDRSVWPRRRNDEQPPLLQGLIGCRRRERPQLRVVRHSNCGRMRAGRRYTSSYCGPLSGRRSEWQLGCGSPKTINGRCLHDCGSDLAHSQHPITCVGSNRCSNGVGASARVGLYSRARLYVR